MVDHLRQVIWWATYAYLMSQQFGSTASHFPQMGGNVPSHQSNQDKLRDEFSLNKSNDVLSFVRQAKNRENWNDMINQ